VAGEGGVVAEDDVFGDRLTRANGLPERPGGASPAMQLAWPWCS
jgi:hypothetical protein